MRFYFLKIALIIKIVKVLNQKPERQYELQLHKPSAWDGARAAPGMLEYSGWFHESTGIATFQYPTLGCQGLQTGDQTGIFSMFKCLTGGCEEDKARFFLEVSLKGQAEVGMNWHKARSVSVRRALNWSRLLPQPAESPCQRYSKHDWNMVLGQPAQHGPVGEGGLAFQRCLPASATLWFFDTFGVTSNYSAWRVWGYYTTTGSNFPNSREECKILLSLVCSMVSMFNAYIFICHNPL